MADKPILMTGGNVIRIVTCAKCGKVSIPFPCEHCGSTGFCKGQTRRIAKADIGCDYNGYEGEFILQPGGTWHYESVHGSGEKTIKPRYQVGDRAYVKEGYKINYANMFGLGPVPRIISGRYLADNTKFEIQLQPNEWKLLKARKKPFGKTPGRFMYKSLARIFLEILEVKVERVQEITSADCEKEGLELTKHPNLVCGKYNRILDDFKCLWNSIHSDGAWERNDWVFVYKFKRIDNGIL